MWLWLKFGSKTKILNTRSTPTADAQKPGEKTASKNVELAKADEAAEEAKQAEKVKEKRLKQARDFFVEIGPPPGLARAKPSMSWSRRRRHLSTNFH